MSEEEVGREFFEKLQKLIHDTHNSGQLSSYFILGIIDSVVFDFKEQLNNNVILKSADVSNFERGML